MSCKEWVQKCEVRPSCSLLWNEQGRSLCVWGVYRPRQGVRQRWAGWTWWAPAWQNAEEIGGLSQYLGIWLLRVMGVEKFGTQRQYSAIQDLIFLPSYKFQQTSMTSLSTSGSLSALWWKQLWCFSALPSSPWLPHCCLDASIAAAD